MLLGTATSATSATSYTAPAGTSYKLYQWSFDTGVLAPNYWSPQSIVSDLATSQGHLEITAAAGGTTFDTFSPAAADFCGGVAPGPRGRRQPIFGRQIHRAVRSDRRGLRRGTPFVSPLQGMISDSHTQGYSAVAWSVGYYTVENGKKIYA